MVLFVACRRFLPIARLVVSLAPFPGFEAEVPFYDMLGVLF